ncbi:MAG: hypothetical protein NUV60_02505 [Patescibacteria group bacterium]|nr:hypothetical protein [Patescibacteria group bacterium]
MKEERCVMGMPIEIEIVDSGAKEALEAAFAVGKKGIEFIERLPDFEGYQIDAQGTATLTSGFGAYTIHT